MISSSRAEIILLSIASLVFGAVIIIILMITLISFCMRRKRNKGITQIPCKQLLYYLLLIIVNKERMCSNPAYGQGLYYNNVLSFLVIVVIQVYHPSAQRSEFRANVNPAYETVAAFQL